MIWERCQELIGQSSNRHVLTVGPAYVEDAAAGSILLQVEETQTKALPHTWLMRGKDLRALSVESYMNSGRARITEHAYRKTDTFKELHMNHLWAQLNSFVMGDKEAHKRSDDLLDACVYCACVASLEWPIEDAVQTEQAWSATRPRRLVSPDAPIPCPAPESIRKRMGAFELVAA